MLLSQMGQVWGREPPLNMIVLCSPVCFLWRCGTGNLVGSCCMTCMTLAAGLLAWSMVVRHSQGQDSRMCSASGISSVATQLSINHITRHRDFLM